MPEAGDIDVRMGAGCWAVIQSGARITMRVFSGRILRIARNFLFLSLDLPYVEIAAACS